MRSGELARAAGVSADTLRHYERLGLLANPPRTANGYRIYPVEALTRVLRIQAALRIGFTLRELAEVLRERDQGRPPCRRVRELAATKLIALDARLEELRRAREQLRVLIAGWDHRLAELQPGEPARLLDQLVGENPSPDAKAPRSQSWRRNRTRKGNSS